MKEDFQSTLAYLIRTLVDNDVIYFENIWGQLLGDEPRSIKRLKNQN